MIDRLRIVQRFELEPHQGRPTGGPTPESAPRR